MTPPFPSADYDPAPVVCDEESLANSRGFSDWQQMNLEGTRGPDPALVNPLLLGKVLSPAASLCQSPQPHAAPLCWAEPQPWCAKGRKSRATRGGQCSSQLHWPDWETEALHQSRLDVGDTVLPTIGLQAAFQLSVPCIPPQHFTEHPLREFVAWVYSSLLSLRLWGLSRTFIHPPVTGWRINHYRHNQRSEELPRSTRSSQQELNMALNSITRYDASPRLHFHGWSSPPELSDKLPSSAPHQESWAKDAR